MSTRIASKNVSLDVYAVAERRILRSYGEKNNFL
jgi:hypothetical protein